MNLKKSEPNAESCWGTYILWHSMIKWCDILHFMFNFSSRFKRFFERIFKCFIHFLETLLWYWNHSLMRRSPSCHSCQFSFLPQWVGLALVRSSSVSALYMIGGSFRASCHPPPLPRLCLLSAVCIFPVLTFNIELTRWMG